jgi:hypothetical protein
MPPQGNDVITGALPSKADTAALPGPAERYMRRDKAAAYLLENYGFGSKQTLAKGVVTGDTPAFHKAGRRVLYTQAALDAWALAKISAPRRSSSDTTHNHQSAQ